MRYLLENDYTQRLYAQIGASCPDLTLLKHDKICGIGDEDTLVLDENDWVHYMASGKTPKEVIVFGEKSPLYGKYRTISKYQPAKKIQTALLNVRHPIILLTSDVTIRNIDAILSIVSRGVEADYTVSFNYPPQNPFDLFSFLVDFSHEVTYPNRIDVCQTLKDHLKPPITDIASMVHSLSEKGKTLMVSTPLKGTLDQTAMELCDSIIFLKMHEDETVIESLPSIATSCHLKVIDLSKANQMHQIEESLEKIFWS